MKKVYIIITFLLVTIYVHAQSVIVITAANFQFTPSAITATCGDTIKWQWISGSHTTTSISVPAGASSWNQPLTSVATTYSMVVTVPGNYSYQCTPHAPNMAGTIIVVCTNSVASVNNGFSSSVYPNPFSSKLFVEFSDADLIFIYNVVGEKIKTITLSKGQTKAELNATDLREGIYFCCILKEGVVIETRKIVKN
ncbi:MAG: T9SS type A sorting domain-containing protein [Bacteroidetes bacterium]|nr:T9SS type A sorting domain-containing protein [Bacteroidota bacterium]